MFHVEQKETHIEVVDHFLTKETFIIQKTWLPGLLQTHPSPSKNEIQKYLKIAPLCFSHVMTTDTIRRASRSSMKSAAILLVFHAYKNLCFENM